jgi:tetratricopeptide (TPR) repeat protein
MKNERNFHHMRNKTSNALIIVATLVVLAAPLYADSRPHHRPPYVPPPNLPPVEITILDTAREQIALARKLDVEAVRAGYTSEEDSYLALTRVLGHYQAVARFWPSDADAVGEASVAAAELFVSRRLFPNAIDEVTRALEVASATRHAPALYRILGSAQARLGRFAEAEEAFLNGERHPWFHRIRVGERGALLGALAGLYQDTGRPREAARCHREAAMLYKDRPLWRAMLLLASAEQTISHDRRAARAELAELERVVREVSQMPLSNPASMETRQEIEDRFKALVDQLSE